MISLILIRWIVFYLVDSAIQRLNNRGLVFLYIVGYLNEWIMECQQQGHKVFLGADSKFLDAIADPDLSPLSQDKWNLWMQCSASEKGNVSPSTGMRTDLNLQFDRPHPKSLLPDLTSGHFVLCIDHGFTRVVGNLVMKVARTSVDLESRLVSLQFFVKC